MKSTLPTQSVSLVPCRHRARRSRFIWTLAFSLLVGAGVSRAFTPTNAAEMWAAYKQAFYYVINGDEGYFRLREGTGTTAATYWFAYCIESAIDAKDVTVVNNTLKGFVAQLTNHYGSFPTSGNPAEDDNIEFALVFERAYQLTGNVAYLNNARASFDMVWNRSWDSAGGGGLWRDYSTKNTKSAQVNAPACLVAYLIYQSGGGSAYLTKSQQIYNWMIANGLWNSSTGQVNPTPGDTTHPLSADAAYFAACSYCLGYGDRVATAGNFIKNTWGTGLQGFGPGSALGPVNGINLRWLTKSGYDPVFLQACVDRGIGCTNSRGLVGPDFREPTSNDAQYAADCSNIVAGVFCVTPAPLTYALFVRSTNQALTAGNGGRSNGTPLVQSPYVGTSHQQWQINSLGNGQYAAIGTGSGRAVDVGGASQSDNAQVDLMDWANIGNQKYTLIGQGGGFYNIVFVHSGKAMEVLNNSVSSGASIVQYTAGTHGFNAQWSFQPIASKGTWALRVLSTDLALDASGAATANGTQLNQSTYHAGTNQQWNINPLGNWQYYATGVASGRAVDVNGYSMDDNAKVDLWTWANVGNQKFVLGDEGGGSGYCSVVFVHSGKAMQVLNNSSAVGAHIVQYTLGANGHNQWWQFRAP